MADGAYDTIFFGIQSSATDPALMNQFWLSSGAFHFWNPGQTKPGTAWEARLDAEQERFAHVTVDGLAALSVSFIKGCAVQSMIDPEHFNIQHYLAAAEALIGQFMASGPQPSIGTNQENPL